LTEIQKDTVFQINQNENNTTEKIGSMMNFLYNNHSSIVEAIQNIINLRQLNQQNSTETQTSISEKLNQIIQNFRSITTLVQESENKPENLILNIIQGQLKDIRDTNDQAIKNS
jgi:translation elongation factor EF-Ts